MLATHDCLVNSPLEPITPHALVALKSRHERELAKCHVFGRRVDYRELLKGKLIKESAQD